MSGHGSSSWPRRLARGLLWAGLVTVIVGVLLPAISMATGLPKARSAPATGHVTILVLDMSGSMNDNDPAGLRCSAANAYISLSGPSDYIGVVGLNNHDSSRGGAHDFERAQVWSPPVEMSTLAKRQALMGTIAAKSNHCQPDGNTPTYDALNQALAMLTKATADTKRTGSAILLTDGVPAPDQDAQISAVKQELVPRFRAGNFPIDTIALGQDTRLHPFLSDLANATSGKAYDDSVGVVPGTSALNIAPFFVSIFAQRNHRTLGPTIAPVQLGGETAARNFQLGSYVDHLDVIAIKDNPATQVFLTTPANQTLPPQVAGTFVSTDPHYAIFSIDGPQEGTWTLSATGSGLFLMDSLIESSLAVSITSPATSPALPLGQTFTIKARITHQGSVVSGHQFTVRATVKYAGDASSSAPAITPLLNDNQVPGTYQANVNVPDTYPSGSYSVEVDVSRGSQYVLSSHQISVRLELFPVPFLLAKGSATTATVDARAVAWDPLLRGLYSLPVGLVNGLSGWPLENTPASTGAAMPGVIQLKGRAYPDATARGYAIRVGTKVQIPITVTDQGQGHFRVLFPTAANGTYTIYFQTSGTFADSHGDFGTTMRKATVTIVPATPQQEIRAWAITLLYLFALAVILNFFRRPFMARPAGSYLRSAPGEEDFEGDFRNARRWNLLRWYFRPNILTSREAFGAPGVVLRFGRGGLIEARRARGARRGGRDWQRADEARWHGYDSVGQLNYRPGGEEAATYTLSSSDGQPGGSRYESGGERDYYTAGPDQTRTRPSRFGALFAGRGRAASGGARRERRGRARGGGGDDYWSS